MNSTALSPGPSPLPNAETIHLEQAAVITSKLAHDFGAYLTGVMGFTELSLQQAPPGGTQQRYLREVLDSAKAGSDWLQRLHSFCRRSDFPGWPGCIGLALAEAEARLLRDQHAGMVLKIDLPADLPMVAADAESLGVILRELTANAKEACAEKAVIEISARVVSLSEAESAGLLGSPVPGEYVEWSVCDDGPAIDPRIREKLLKELFFSTKPKHRGLGLWMIYGLVKRHGGGIGLFSGSAERGFGVSMVLPLARVPLFEANSAEKLAVLLLLSDPIGNANMARVLEASGCLPTSVLSSVEALEMVTNQPDRFRVAVVETQMGGESGMNLARRMLEKAPALRFVFVHPRASYARVAEEELVKRFPLIRGPLELASFFQAMTDAIRTDAIKAK